MDLLRIMKEGLNQDERGDIVQERDGVTARENDICPYCIVFIDCKTCTTCDQELPNTKLHSSTSQTPLRRSAWNKSIVTVIGHQWDHKRNI